MKITSIVENTSNTGLPVEHGLSLYIELSNRQNVLFDMGQGRLFSDNAKRLKLNIEDVDTAIISHGHYDHGGGLETFLELNKKASIYIHQDAFKPHYSLHENGLRYIGIKQDLCTNERIVKCGAKVKVDEQMTLFADVHGEHCCPHGNILLYGPEKTENDSFSHEQNLIIEEADNIVLIAGCAHKGILNIMQKAIEITGKVPTHVFAGMHLVKSGLSEEDEQSFIETLATELLKYENTKFCTMHCTGTEQYLKLKSKMGEQIQYLSCGEIYAF